MTDLFLRLSSIPLLVLTLCVTSRTGTAQSPARTNPATATSGRRAAAAPRSIAPKPVTIGNQFTLHSTILGEDRPIQIHLPPSYAQQREARYPVLYLLDGDFHFASVSAMVDFLAGNDRGPEMIVVSIPNTKDRTRDLTPHADAQTSRLVLPGLKDPVEQQFPTAGGAAKLRAFITSELAPWIGKNYRTVPYRILVGHSFGGLFVLDALADNPRHFNAYIAISPSLWWDEGRYTGRVAARLANADLSGVSLYMTTGDREGATQIDPARTLAAALEPQRASGFRFEYRVMPGESHGSNPLRTEYDALEQLFNGWAPADSVTMGAFYAGSIAPLEAHRAALAARFGFPVSVSPQEVNAMAYFNLEQKKFDIALRLFRHTTDTSPNNAYGWDGLALGLEAQGQHAEAVAAAERAVSIAQRTGDPALATYRAHLGRLRKGAVTRH